MTIRKQSVFLYELLISDKWGVGGWGGVCKQRGGESCKPPDLDQTRFSFMRHGSHLFDNALHRFLCLRQPAPQLVQFYVPCHKSQLFTNPPQACQPDHWEQLTFPNWI